ncbi:hypothetical protein LCGC14_2377180 [marine sediment metagenome]|uniref:Uncharacterized protein n=1 Tax=marine sediment metagenome TaxID=412755 RepID=A0A0F9EEG5_9ZZZZ
MSEEAEMTAEEETQPAEEKLLTATQLFSKYMTVRGRVQKMTAALGEEVSSMGALGDELAARFGIYVSGSKPQAPRPRQPSIMPGDGPLMNEADGEKPAFKPSAQYHADAPTLDSPGSAEVAEIRRDAGLSEAAADSEQLAATGLGIMAELGKSLPGTPRVVATPGEHHDKAAAAAQERSNAEGGPVRQGPVKE